MLFQASMITFFGGLLAASVSAAPVELAAREDSPLCTPNLSGVPVKVVNTITNDYWSVPRKSEGYSIYANSISQDEADAFIFELNGEVNNPFTIKLANIPDNSLLAQFSPAKELVVGTVGTVSTAGTPRFIVECLACPVPGSVPASGDIMALGCTITDIDSGLPVTELSGSRLGGATASPTANQRFILVA